MIGPAEIEDMMTDYAEALAQGDPDAVATRPVWFSATDVPTPTSSPKPAIAFFAVSAS